MADVRHFDIPMLEGEPDRLARGLDFLAAWLQGLEAGSGIKPPADAVILLSDAAGIFRAASSGVMGSKMKGEGNG